MTKGAFGRVLLTLVSLLAAGERGRAQVGMRVLDLDGELHVLGDQGSLGLALVVLGNECPISNQMLPELNVLARVAHQHELEFLGVFSDPFLERAEARRHNHSGPCTRACTAPWDVCGPSSIGPSSAPAATGARRCSRP